MADPEAQVPTAYGHPGVVTAMLFFKVSALVVYILCGLFSNSFVANFVVVVVLLMFDFWTTKNVAGRLLVGLRWWNEVTAEGSNWRFETLEEGQRQINKRDSAAFWWSLYLVPAAWLILGVVELARLKFNYLLCVAVAVVLGGSNVVGFTKCSKQASQQVRSMAQSAVQQGFAAAMARV